MKKAVVAAALLAPLAGAAAIADASEPTFSARTVTHTGTVHVDAPPEQAFQMFTAPGERLWVPGWDPVVLNGGDGRAEGTVFVTTHNDEQTVWVVVDYRPESLRARYARIAPASRAGTVAVRVLPNGLGGSDVDVTYELTALNAAGNRVLEAFDENEFSRMLTGWEDAIRAARIELPIRFSR